MKVNVLAQILRWRKPLKHFHLRLKFCQDDSDVFIYTFFRFGQDVPYIQILSWVKLVWIQSFPSPRQVD